MDLEKVLTILNLVNATVPAAARFALMFKNDDGTVTELTTPAEQQQDALDTLDRAEAQTNLNIAHARARQLFLESGIVSL